MKALYNYYDTDNDGTISYNEFANALVTELSERANNMVEKAWESMGGGQEQSGDALKKAHRCENEACALLEHFKGTKGGNNLGTISRDEFFAHYREVATGILSDEYFVRHMEAAWPIFEDRHCAVDRARLQEMMQTVRHKIILKSNN